MAAVWQNSEVTCLDDIVGSIFGPVVQTGYADQVISIGKVTLGEEARKNMRQKQQKVKEKEAILQAACALLNSGGGAIKMEFYNQQYSFEKDALGEDLKLALIDLVNPAHLHDFFEFQQLDKLFIVFVKSWCSSINQSRICSISTGLFQRSETSVMEVSSIAVHEYCQRKKDAYENKKIIQFYKRNSVNLNETLDFGESMTVDFKDFRSENLLVRLGECLPKYVSAFANTGSGYLFIGVDNERRVTGCGHGENKEKLEGRVRELCSKFTEVHRQSCSKSTNWLVDCSIIEVQGGNSYVLGIKIPASCCLVFQKQPDSWQIEDSNLHRFTAQQWLEILDSTDPVKQSGSFTQLSLKAAPPQCRTVYGYEETHLENLQAKLFPVSEGVISVGPHPLTEDLFERYGNLRNLQTLERQKNVPGALIFSKSWAHDIGREKNNNVICDAVLICQNSLPCLYTVVKAGTQDLWEYATSTAFHLKQKLVNMGGYSERICVVPKLVHCQTGELIPRENSPFGLLEILYPDSYKLSGVDEIKSVLRSLVIVLLSFTSALSDELGCKVLNLFTEEQFKILTTYDGIRELFVHGLPGSGKTVLAAEKIKRIKEAYRCKKENILYICENKPLKNFMSKKDICCCATRKSFMVKNNFRKVHHIIVDEGQNFRDENGDWMDKAKNIVKEDGVFWVFLDYFQQSHTKRNGLLPVKRQNKAYLYAIVRNSRKVSTYLKEEIDNICKHPFTNGEDEEMKVVFKNLTDNLDLVNHFAGDCDVKEMAKDEIVPNQRKVLHELSQCGSSPKDIAVLCSTREDSTKLSREFDSKSEPRIRFTSAEDMDEDKVVLDSIRRFSGLERNIVILVDPHVHASQDKVEINLLVAGISRARIKLIVFNSTGKGTESIRNGTDSPGNGTGSTVEMPDEGGVETRARPMPDEGGVETRA